MAVFSEPIVFKIIELAPTEVLNIPVVLHSKALLPNPTW